MFYRRLLNEILSFASRINASKIRKSSLNSKEKE